MDLLDQFLLVYANQQGLQFTGLTEAKRKLCECYHYNPTNHRELSLICYGWIWGKTNCELMARASCLIKYRMEDVYNQVAEEQGWEK